MALDFVIIGGGPAGTQAATVAARLGARVTVIERDVVGGAAHLWDCVPSKAMIAAGAGFGDIRDAHSMGVQTTGTALDLTNLAPKRFVAKTDVRSIAYTAATGFPAQTRPPLATPAA